MKIPQDAEHWILRKGRTIRLPAEGARMKFIKDLLVTTSESSFSNQDAARNFKKMVIILGSGNYGETLLTSAGKAQLSVSPCF